MPSDPPMPPFVRGCRDCRARLGVRARRRTLSHHGGVSARRIVRTYYVLAGLYTLAASLIWSVNTLFLLDAGLDIGEVFVANAFFSAGMVIFEIPTGVVADTRGRRVSYLASLVILALTTLLYLWAAQVEAGVVAFSLISVFHRMAATAPTPAMVNVSRAPRKAQGPNPGTSRSASAP